jgi:hypothetical protein
MVEKLISLALIAYLPGALLYRAPFASRDRRAALPAEERAFWAVIISVILSTTIAFGLAALGMYSLRNLATCNVVLMTAVALASLGLPSRLRRSGATSNLRFGPAAAKLGWTAVFPAVLIALCVWMYFAVPASEYVLGGRDPGVYMSEGIQIAQRRSLITTDPLVAVVPQSNRDLFFPFFGQPGYYSVRFMGFHLRDPDAGSVSGQFPQGYPIWIAIAYGLDGITGTRRVIAWWAILGVLAVYFAGTRLIGAFPAAAAAGLLSVHVIQTWYARYPNSEVMTQALLFAALLAHAYAHEDDIPFFGPLSASLLGLALFTRFPAVLAVVAAVGASLLAYVNGRRPRGSFLATLAAWIVAAGIYYTTQLRPYFSRPITYLQSLGAIHLFLLAAAGGLALALLWAIRRPGVATAVRRWLPIALITAVAVGSVHALFFRHAGAGLAAHDAYAVRTFARFYLTPFALALALAGYALVVWRSFWRAPALLLTISAFAFFFFYKLRIFPEHFWLSRRFVDAILPAALLFVSAAALLPLSRITSSPWTLRPVVVAARIVTGLLIVALLGQEYLHASQRIRTHVEYAGLIPTLERLAGRFNDDDLVIVEAREASDVHVLALPLSYIYARNVLVLYRSRPDKASLREFLNWSRERYKNVYFIAGGGTDLLSPGIGAEVVESERFQVSEYEKTTYDTYPTRVPLKPFDFTIYKLVESSAATAPHALDLGGPDDLYLVDFHPKERLGKGELTFRWTQERSYLLMGIPAGGRELVLTLSNGRPKSVAPGHVSVIVEGHDLGRIEPTSDMRSYTFPIPAGVASELAKRTGPSEIQIQSSVWIPREAVGGSDNRALGVMIDRAEIR